MQQQYLCNPFPRQYQQQTAYIKKLLMQPELCSDDCFSAVVEGERLAIPSRVYHACNKNMFKGLLMLESQIAACFFSRHHNGYVREECLSFLLRPAALPAFVLPYLLKLAEEYVVELVEMLWKHFSLLSIEALTRFVLDNPKWMPLMYQRCVSYWNCYYRRQYPHLKDYPGIVIFNELNMIIKKTPD